VSADSCLVAINFDLCHNVISVVVMTIWHIFLLGCSAGLDCRSQGSTVLIIHVYLFITSFVYLLVVAAADHITVYVTRLYL